MLTSNGVMIARYTLFNSLGSVYFSGTTSAKFNFDSEVMLPPPIIQHKDSHGEVSTKDILLYQGVKITIPASELLLKGDELQLYW